MFSSLYRYTVESRYFEPPRKTRTTKIGSENRREITVFHWVERNELSGGSKNKASRNWDSSLYIHYMKQDCLVIGYCNSCYFEFEFYDLSRHWISFLFSATERIPIFRASKGNKNWFEKSGVKLQSSTEEREATFGSSYPEVWKTEGSRNLYILISNNHRRAHTSFRNILLGRIWQLLQLKWHCRSETTNRAGGLYWTILTEVVSTDRTQWSLYIRPRSRFSHTDRPISINRMFNIWQTKKIQFVLCIWYFLYVPERRWAELKSTRVWSYCLLFFLSGFLALLPRIYFEKKIVNAFVF